MDANIDNTDNRNDSAPHPIESELIDSWTFLGDDSPHPINHQGSGVEIIAEHAEHTDDDAKSPSKTSRSSSSCVS